MSFLFVRRKLHINHVHISDWWCKSGSHKQPMRQLVQTCKYSWVGQDCAVQLVVQKHRQTDRDRVRQRQGQRACECVSGVKAASVWHSECISTLMISSRRVARQAVVPVPCFSGRQASPHHAVCPLTDAIDLLLTRRPGDTSVPSRSSSFFFLPSSLYVLSTEPTR